MTRTDKLLRPGKAAKILNVSTETLRLWEEGGKLPFAVQRTRGGERRYPAAHVHALADAMRGKTPSEVLATMADMVMMPAEQEISPGITEVRHSDGSVGYWGEPSKIAAARAEQAGYLDPRQMQCVDAPYPNDWRVGEDLAVLSLAHNADGEPSIGQQMTPRCPVIVVTMCVLSGPARGQLTDIRIPVDTTSAECSRIVSSLVGYNVRKPPKDAPPFTLDLLQKLMREHVYLATISARSVDMDWGFAPPGVTHEVTFKRVENLAEVDPKLPLTFINERPPAEPVRAFVGIDDDVDDWGEGDDDF
jgi:hypothetical protein